jgi:hypothetical protein
MDRKPKGYQGIGHETIGSDLLAVSNALNTPESVLSLKTLDRLKQLEPARFYPVDWFLELMDELEASIGRVALVRLGRKVFELSHQERVLKTARSARDIVYGIDAMYHHAHRGQAIGGWHVLSFSPGRAELEKTTPCHCQMEEGILLQALFALGAPSRIEQRECFRKGAQSCIYSITSVIENEKWTGSKTDG